MTISHIFNLRPWVSEQLRNNSGIKSLLAGKPDKNLYIQYLKNVYQYAQHSPKVMALAASRCMNSHPEIAKYFLHHAEEEQGHDLWALGDLRELGVDEAKVRASRPVHACSAMIGFTYYTAGYMNPVGLLGWLYVLETVGNDLGSVATERLQAGLGLSDRALKFVAGHGLSDPKHTEDLVETLRTHVKSEQDIADISYVADVSADLYVRMFAEIAEGAKVR